MFEFSSQRRTRTERYQQIFDIVARQGGAIPLRVIARIMGLKVTPYLRELVSTVEADGVIARERLELTNGLPIDVFRLTELGEQINREIERGE